MYTKRGERQTFYCQDTLEGWYAEGWESSSQNDPIVSFLPSIVPYFKLAFSEAAWLALHEHGVRFVVWCVVPVGVVLGLVDWEGRACERERLGGLVDAAI